jgi:hypothetical protein
MTTAYADADVARTEHVRLLYRVIAKPYDPEQIKALVSEAIRDRDFRRELHR